MTYKSNYLNGLYKWRPFLALALAAGLPPGFVLNGETPPPPEAREAASMLLVQFDNDLFAGTDQNYSSGTRIAYGGNYRRAPEFLNGLMSALGNLRAPFSNGHISPYPDRLAWSVGLTTQMFTPDSVEATTPPPGQRPYAGWLGLEGSVQHMDDTTFSSLTLAIGTTGEHAYAEDLQDFTHQYISDDEEYQGWDSQVPGELTVDLLYDRVQMTGLFDGNEEGQGFDIDNFLEWGVALGNRRTHAYVGSRIRFGWSLPAYILSPRIELGMLTQRIPPSLSGHSDWSIHAFASGRGYLVAHDITLDGPLFRDYAYAVESEPLVAEGMLGIGLRYKKLMLLVSRTFRTMEFKTQADDHEYGSVSAVYQF